MKISEGWGITNYDNKTMIISDGTDNLFFVAADEQITKLDIVKTVKVKNLNIFLHQKNLG